MRIHAESMFNEEMKFSKEIASVGAGDKIIAEEGSDSP